MTETEAPCIRRGSWDLPVAGERIAEAALAWHRVPAVLSRWVDELRIADWSAAGWQGELVDRWGQCSKFGLRLERGQRCVNLALGANLQAQYRWSPVGSLVGSRIDYRVAAGDVGAARLLEVASRRLLATAVQRQRWLGRRVVEDAVLLTRCRRCFGPLISRDAVADDTELSAEESRSASTRQSAAALQHCAWGCDRPSAQSVDAQGVEAQGPNKPLSIAQKATEQGCYAQT